jgi:hypothetical protein
MLAPLHVDAALFLRSSFLVELDKTFEGPCPLRFSSVLLKVAARPPAPFLSLSFPVPPSPTLALCDLRLHTELETQCGTVAPGRRL